MSTKIVDLIFNHLKKTCRGLLCNSKHRYDRDNIDELRRNIVLSSVTVPTLGHFKMNTFIHRPL